MSGEATGSLELIRGGPGATVSPSSAVSFSSALFDATGKDLLRPDHAPPSPPPPTEPGSPRNWRQLSVPRA